MPAKDVSQKKVWEATLIITLIVAFMFLLPQLSVLILACLMSFVFYPLYLRLKRKNGWVAACATLAISLLIVIVPIMIVLVLTAAQLFQLAEQLNTSDTIRNISLLLDAVNSFLRHTLEPLTGIHANLNTSSIGEFLRTSLPELIRGFSGFILGIVGNIPQFAVACIIYIFVFVELLVRGDKLVRLIYDISPYDRTVTANFLERIGLMANAMVKGQLIISMIISAIAALLLVPLGYGPYVFILFILFTILNFIPLGCGIVVFPLAIYSGLTGAFWPAVIVLIAYSIAANIDSILRPIFIPKKIQLSTALTMVAAFCGIAYFGILGVVYGPIILLPLAGLVLGATIGYTGIQSVFGTGVTSTTVAILVAIVFGLVLALLSYSFFDIAIVVMLALAFSSFFTLFGILIGLSANGFAVFMLSVAGFIIGLLFALSSPMIAESLVTFVTAFIGAGLILGGVFVLAGGATLADMHTKGVLATVVAHVHNSFWWIFVWIAGTVIMRQIQLRSLFLEIFPEELGYSATRQNN